MAKPAPAVVAAFVLAGAVLGVCPWDDRARGAWPASFTASLAGPPTSEQGIECPIDDR